MSVSSLAGGLADARVERSERWQQSTPAGERWVFGGVAAELALRLDASAAFIRTLLCIAAFFQFWPVLIVYAVLAAVLPRLDRRRRLGWTNLVALLRLGGFVGLAELSRLGIATFNVAPDSGSFSQPPTVWIPVEGTLLLLWVALLTNRRPARGIPSSADRRAVLSTIPPGLVAAAVVLGVEFAPKIRADRLLDVGLIALGATAAVAGQRLDLRAYAAATVPLAVLALTLAGAGVSLLGGVGDIEAAPRSISAARTYVRAVGNITLDLTGLRADGRRPPPPLAIDVGAGNVTIDVPAQAVTTIHVSIGEGTLARLLPAYLQLNDRWLLQHTIVVDPRQASGEEFSKARFAVTVDVHLGHGCVSVGSRAQGTSGGC